MLQSQVMRSEVEIEYGGHILQSVAAESEY